MAMAMLCLADHALAVGAFPRHVDFRICQRDVDVMPRSGLPVIAAVFVSPGCYFSSETSPRMAFARSSATGVMFCSAMRGTTSCPSRPQPNPRGGAATRSSTQNSAVRGFVTVPSAECRSREFQGRRGVYHPDCRRARGTRKASAPLLLTCCASRARTQRWWSVPVDCGSGQT